MTTLVLGPSLGTSAHACWGPCAELLGDDFEVLGWELPGHGAARGEHAGAGDVTIEGLAEAVLGEIEGAFLYAGDSVGGEVGLQLLLDAPDRVLGAVLCCTGARIGDHATWRDRAEQVRASGTASLVTSSAERWFSQGFLEREPERGSALLDSLRDASDDGYVAVCGALAAYDVRDRLGEIEAPVVAVAGADDPVCPPELLREIAEGVRHGRLVVLDGCGHLAPVERPHDVARIIHELAQEVS